MKLDRKDLLLYAITDRAWLKEGQSLAEAVEEAILGGATIVQLREKQMTKEELKAEALEVLAVCRKYKVPFIINDDVSLAAEIQADGVHVGQNDMEIQSVRAMLGPDKIIGVTAKTVSQAIKAQAGGADYLGSGAVFGSTTKKDAVTMSHDLLDEICEAVEIPVVAIGGINMDNVHQLFGRKMAGIATVSGVFASDNIKESTSRFRHILEGGIIQ